MKLINHLVYSDLVTSLCAASLCFFTLTFLEFELFFTECIGLVFFATWFTYLFHRLIDHKFHGNLKKTNRDLWHFENSILGLISLILSFSGSFYFILSLPSSIAAILFPLGVFSIAYIWQFPKLPFLPLRNITYLKPFVIAFCWSMAVTGIPVTANISSLEQMKPDYLLLSLSILFFLFGQVIQFDLRDRQIDFESGLITFAHKFNSNNLILVSIMSYFISLISLFFVTNFNPLLISALALGLLGSGILILISRKRKQDFYYSFYLESSLAYPFLFLQLLIFLGE